MGRGHNPNYTSKETNIIASMIDEYPMYEPLQLARKIQSLGLFLDRTPAGLRFKISKLSSKKKAAEQLVLEQTAEQLELPLNQEEPFCVDVVPFDFVFQSFGKMLRYDAEKLPVDFHGELDWLYGRAFKLKVMEANHDA